MLYIIAMSTMTYNKLEGLCDLIIKKYKESEGETDIVSRWKTCAVLRRASRIVLRKAQEGWELYKTWHPDTARRFRRIIGIMLDLPLLDLDEKDRLTKSKVRIYYS